MKWSLILFTMLLSMPAFASQRENREETIIARDEIDEIEIRIRNYLEDYLHPDEFMVFVNYNANAKNSTGYRSSPSNIGLPGVPGLDPQAESEAGVNYYDIDGTLHGKVSHRPPITVSIVLGRTVSAEKVRLFRRVLPQLSRLDRTRGDTFRLSTGELKKEFQPDISGQNWVDSVFRHKRELFSLIFGLAAAILVVVLFNGLMNFFAARKNSRADSDAAIQAAQALQIPKSPSAVAEKTGSDGKKKALTREELYSNDSQFLDTVKDVVSVARQHPGRMAYLLTDWIQAGGTGIRNASILLNNFDLSASEGVLQKLVPSDIDRLKGDLDTKFDPFTEDNVRVIYQARLDLMKITSYFARQQQRHNDLAFLSDLDDDLLTEVLRGQAPRVLAFISSQVPIHRIMPYLAKFKPQEESEFFRNIVNFDKVPKAEREKMVEALRARVDEMLHLSFTKSSKVATLAKLIRNLPTPSRQERVLNEMAKISPQINEEVRDQVFVFQDVIGLPQKLLQTLVVEEDAVIVARAFSRSPVDKQELVLACLPAASSEIFLSEISATHRIRPSDVERARARLVLKLEQLIEEKVIDIHEVRADKEEDEAAEGLRVAG